MQPTDLEGIIAALKKSGGEVHTDAPRGAGPIRYVYVSAPDGVVLELVELRLPAKLARLAPVFRGVNRAIHATRRAFAKQLFAQPPTPTVQSTADRSAP